MIKHLGLLFSPFPPVLPPFLSCLLVRSLLGNYCSSAALCRGLHIAQLGQLLPSRNCPSSPTSSAHTRAHTPRCFLPQYPLIPSLLRTRPQLAPFLEHLGLRRTPQQMVKHTHTHADARAHTCTPKDCRALGTQRAVWRMGDGHAFVQRLGALQAHARVWTHRAAHCLLHIVRLTS